MGITIGQSYTEDAVTEPTEAEVSKIEKKRAKAEREQEREREQEQKRAEAQENPAEVPENHGQFFEEHHPAQSPVVEGTVAVEVPEEPAEDPAEQPLGNMTQTVDTTVEDPEIADLDVDGYDPGEHGVGEVNTYLAKADDAERERVLTAERAGKARKGILEA